MMYDAIVVGARCAGSPTAMLLARSGHRVLLVDRASFPSDTMSTNLIHPPGVARLGRWGLLGRVAASNCPPCHEISMDFGAFSLSGHPPPIDGVAEHYCPRRTVLDKILVDAAVEAGAQLREGFRVGGSSGRTAAASPASSAEPPAALGRRKGPASSWGQTACARSWRGRWEPPNTTRGQR